MKNKTKYLLYGGLGGIIFYLLIQILPILFLCEQGGLGCFVLFMLPFAIPTIIADTLHLPKITFITISFIIIFYASIGALISYLVYYFKHERKK